jgi:hypothetical protein
MYVCSAFAMSRRGHVSSINNLATANRLSRLGYNPDAVKRPVPAAIDVYGKYISYGDCDKKVDSGSTVFPNSIVPT